MSSISAAATLDTTGTNSSDASRQSLASDFDSFLLILTTQLQNQDPLSPTDTHEFTNQLVLFADVEQSIQQNANLEEMITLQANNQAIGALSYMGTEVEAEGNLFTLEEGEDVTLAYDLADTAKTAAITISDINGDPVLVTSVNDDFGRHEFTWDGKGLNGVQIPGGVYSFQVNAVDANEQQVTVKTSTFNEIDGVETDSSGTFLTSGQLSIPVEKVFAVRQPTATQSGI